MGAHRILVFGLLLVSTPAAAEIELKNDGFVTNATVGFQAGFAAGEGGASRFVAPAAGRQLLKVQLLFGGAATQATVTVKVFDDTAGTDAPGGELHNADYQLTGSDSAMQQIDLSAANITVPAQFRVAILFPYAGLPSIARDADNTITAAKNFIFDGTLGWQKSAVFGLTGDWVIRAFVSDGAGMTTDGPAAGTDAGVGATCNGNGSCPSGQFCDVANHACTFECRMDDDCGGGACNSLGMCVAGADSGGCCRADGGGAGAGVLVGLGTLAMLIVLRRRNPCD